MKSSGLKRACFCASASGRPRFLSPLRLRLATAGGGGGGITLPVSTPTTVPSAAATASPTPAPAPAPVVTVVAIPSGGTTAPIANVGDYTGSVAIPAPATGVGANVTITAATAPLVGIPTLQNLLRRPRAVSGAPGLFYISLVSDGTLTFTGYPTISLTLPASTGLTANQSFYIASFRTITSVPGTLARSPHRW